MNKNAASETVEAAQNLVLLDNLPLHQIEKDRAAEAFAQAVGLAGSDYAFLVDHARGWAYDQWMYANGKY